MGVDVVVDDRVCDRLGGSKKFERGEDREYLVAEVEVMNEERDLGCGWGGDVVRAVSTESALEKLSLSY